MTILTLLVGLLVSMVGCVSTPPVPTPNLYVGQEVPLFESLSPALSTNEVHVLYVTDRGAIESSSTGVQDYGSERSLSMAYGDATVQFGRDLSWTELAELSVDPRAAKRRIPEVAIVEELARLPDFRDGLELVDGVVVDTPDAAAEAAELTSRFHAELEKRLALTSRNEVYVYVHGYNVGFQHSITDMAQLYHFLGREGVPIVYSWPAGRGSLLRGYNADRESSEFTIYHFKQFLSAVASCPEVEGIHVVAHSRGTDVAVTALRELNLVFRAQHLDTAEELKLRNMVVAAPDLDYQVFQQRFGAERLYNATENFTLYLSEADRALGLASYLFDSVRRLGKLRGSDLTAGQQEALWNVSDVSIVADRLKRRDLYGHGYFIMNPAVISDLILLLRYNRAPGAEHGRPLERESSGFWVLSDSSYPN